MKTRSQSLLFAALGIANIFTCSASFSARRDDSGVGNATKESSQDSFNIGLKADSSFLCIDQTASNWTASYAGVHLLQCGNQSVAQEHVTFKNSMVMLGSQGPDCLRVVNTSDATLELAPCNASEAQTFCVDSVGNLHMRDKEQTCLVAVEHQAAQSSGSYYTLSLQTCMQENDSLHVFVAVPSYENLTSELKCSSRNETLPASNEHGQHWENASMGVNNTLPPSHNISMANKTVYNLTSNITSGNWTNASLAPVAIDVSGAFVSCAIQLINVNMNTFSKEEVLVSFVGAVKYALELINIRMQQANWQIEFAGFCNLQHSSCEVFQNSTQYNLTGSLARKTSHKAPKTPKEGRRSTEASWRAMEGDERLDFNSLKEEGSWSLREVGTEVFFFLRSTVVEEWALSLAESEENEEWNYLNSSWFPQTMSSKMSLSVLSLSSARWSADNPMLCYAKDKSRQCNMQELVQWLQDEEIGLSFLWGDFPTIDIFNDPFVAGSLVGGIFSASFVMWVTIKCQQWRLRRKRKRAGKDGEELQRLRLAAEDL
mmetsp:Transcript_15394/g.51672  ORF Transcript_15394/g.51672 Transcript_15394/m.51672 type:complete len:543 (-) Transcript_15394:33-1661(-)